MKLDFPMVNVQCCCGQLLFSWREVEEHWREHKRGRAMAEEYQNMLREMRA